MLKEDEQMLADVLLKKLPVADLRMLDQALGGDRLLMKWGFINGWPKRCQR